MDFESLKVRAHENAVNHGFWAEKHYLEHYLMLVITEVAEAVNADRKYKRADRTMYEYYAEMPCYKVPEGRIELFEEYIKDSVEDELADVVIRLLDLAGARGYDLSEMLAPRADFEDSSFTAVAYYVVRDLATFGDVNSNEYSMKLCLRNIEKWAELMGIDLEWFVLAKMEYNESRPRKHGKKY